MTLRAQPPEAWVEAYQDFPTVLAERSQLDFLVSSISFENLFALAVPAPLQIVARFAFLVSIFAKEYSCLSSK